MSEGLFIFAKWYMYFEKVIITEYNAIMLFGQFQNFVDI